MGHGLFWIPHWSLQITDEQGEQMSIPPPENTADWVHPIIFKPMKAIWLTWSTFKVTTYIDFAPYLENFQTVQDYLQDFKKDLDDPSYMWYLTYSSRLADPTLLHNDNLMTEFMSSSRYQSRSLCLNKPS